MFAHGCGIYCDAQVAGATDHSLFISIGSSLTGLYSEWTYLTPFISSLSHGESTNISLNVSDVGQIADRLRVLDYSKDLEESNKFKVKTWNLDNLYISNTDSFWTLNNCQGSNSCEDWNCGYMHVEFDELEPYSTNISLVDAEYFSGGNDCPLSVH